MEQDIATGGATVVVAIIVAAGVMSHRLRKRGAARGRTLPIALVASAGLLAVGALLALTGGVFG
jgi:hypothetical protein